MGQLLLCHTVRIWNNPEGEAMEEANREEEEEGRRWCSNKTSENEQIN